MTALTPPRLARWLLDRALPDDVRGASVRGDLLEEMNDRAARTSVRAARLWYWRQAIGVAWRARVRRRHSLPERKASVMDALTHDLRFAVRSLTKARGFATVAVLTLALGIGAATAAFSVLNAVLLRPLPFAAPDRLVWMTETNQNDSPTSVSWPNFLDWRERLTSVTDLSAIRRRSVNLTGDEAPEHLSNRQVTWTFFHALGVAPVLGRSFAETDDRPGAPRAVVLGDTFWRRHFNGNPAVIGRTIVLNNDPYEVIGVMPTGFRYNAVTEDDLFTPLSLDAVPSAGLLDRGNHSGLSAVARLRDGVSEETVRRELAAINAALAQAYPGTNAGVRTHVEWLTHRLIGDVAPAIRLMFAAVSLLLLLATFNVANLVVARGVSRRQELSIRAALGCGRLRLARQLLVENGVLALVGGAAGVFAAFALIRLFVATAPEDVPRLNQIGLTGPVWLFAAAISALAAGLLSVLPAIESARVRDQQLLVRGTRGETAAPRAHRIRRALTVAEIAIAIVLVSGAGLMVRTMHALAAVDPGFAPSGVLTLRLQVDGSRSTPDEETAFHRRLVVFHDAVLTRVRALPGVQNAGLTLSLPIEGSQWGSIFIVGDQPVPERAELPSAAFVPVSASYFDTMKMRLRSGRVFGPEDALESQRVAVVNETFARRFWPNESAIGKRLKQSWPEEKTPWREIVGVVDDVKLQGIENATPMQVYLPMPQEPSSYAALVVRSAVPPEDLTRAVSAAIHEIDPNMPLFSVQTFDSLLRASTSQHRMTMTVLGGFAVLALVLACVGLYGVVSHGVIERTREIGVRLALGATRSQVVRLFVRQGLATTIAGMAIGLATAFAAAGLVRGLLFNVTPTDPIAFSITVAVLTIVSLAACYVPARRASRVDPTVALRGE